MTYEEAKKIKQELDDKNSTDSKKLKSFGDFGAMGTPDHIRELPEWKKAKQSFDKSFNELRNFNAWFIKQFKKEYAADRRKNRFKSKAI